MSKEREIFNSLPRKEQEEFVAKVIDAQISANNAIFRLEQFQHSPLWMRETKNYGNLFLKRLMKIEKDFDMLAENNGKLDNLYNDYHDFMEAVSTTHIGKMKDYTKIIEAYKKSPESMLGIANKILK